MMEHKIIKDLVHDYIDLPLEMMEIIDSQSFQRLKFISQLTAQHLYPSVNHSRFEHSLGVMKLARDFFYFIKEQIVKLIGKEEEEYIEYLKYHLTYASLLHDVGHAPLSHMGESFYDNDEINSKIKNLLAEKQIQLKSGTTIEDLLKIGSKHERMSCYVILKNLYSKLMKIYDFDIEFLFRIIIGNKYEGTEKWPENIMISIVNSDTIDVDKLDYLLRDNFMTGHPAPKIDVRRLLYSLYIDKSKELTLKSQALSAIQQIIDSRDSLYLWIYNHHTVVYTDYLTQDLIKHLINLSRKDSSSENESEKIYIEDLFSCEAISDNYVCDIDLNIYLRNAYKLFLKNKSTQYTSKLLPQLFERKFLKPAWKTLWEYNQFMEKHFDDKEINLILDEIANDSQEAEKYRKKIVHLIIENLNLQLGDVFLVKRSNKFYSLNKGVKFYTFLKGYGNKEISNLLPQKDFSKHFTQISFYIFGKDEKIEDIKSEFTNIIKGRLYKNINEI